MPVVRGAASLRLRRVAAPPRWVRRARHFSTQPRHEERAVSEAVPNVRPGSGVVDRVVGKTKEVVGSATDNEDLREEGVLQQQKAAVEEQARKDAADAALSTAEADLTSKERELAA